MMLSYTHKGSYILVRLSSCAGKDSTFGRCTYGAWDLGKGQHERTGSWCSFLEIFVCPSVGLSHWILRSPEDGKPRGAERHMGVSENSGFSPQIIHFNRVFHYFHRPFWGVFAYFWSSTHMSFRRRFACFPVQCGEHFWGCLPWSSK